MEDTVIDFDTIAILILCNSFWLIVVLGLLVMFFVMLAPIKYR
jgi:hypothetical protein